MSCTANTYLRLNTFKENATHLKKFYEKYILHFEWNPSVVKFLMQLQNKLIQICTYYTEGVIGGKFLERSRVKKPGQELFKSEMSEYYKAQDLYVGARLSINNQPFQLVDADEYAFNYMEQHAEEVMHIQHSFIFSLSLNHLLVLFYS